MNDLTLLKTLDTLCAKHDWNYADTDDHSVWKKYESIQKDIDRLVVDLVKSGNGNAVQEILSKYTQG